MRSPFEKVVRRVMKRRLTASGFAPFSTNMFVKKSAECCVCVYLQLSRGWFLFNVYVNLLDHAPIEEDFKKHSPHVRFRIGNGGRFAPFCEEFDNLLHLDASPEVSDVERDARLTDIMQTHVEPLLDEFLTIDSIRELRLQTELGANWITIEGRAQWWIMRGHHKYS